MAKPLSGKIALVTGSGRGLGRLMAERLADRGADVAIHDRAWNAPSQYGEASDLGEVVKAFERFGVRVLAVTGNIGDRERGCGDEGRRSTPSSGAVDILVNCAGGDIGAAGRQAGPEQCARHPAGGHAGADQQQPHRHDHRLQGLHPADAREQAGRRRQHRLGRGASSAFPTARSTLSSRRPSRTTPAAWPRNCTNMASA